MHPSIANLSSRLHLCSGEVPPPLVGASATLVESSHNGVVKGAHVYLFGGRLVSSRRMVNTLYRLDLDEMVWSRLTPGTKRKVGTSEASEPPTQPQPRYFHSADLWNDKIIFFGGMGYLQRSDDLRSGAAVEELCVLDELLAFDLATQQWDYTFDVASHQTATTSQSESLRPAPRYAHLSSLSGDILSIIGGQNLANQYVESINLFSLAQNKWIGAQRFQKQCGSYRSLAVGAKSLFKEGEKAKCYPRAKDPLTGADGSTSTPASTTSPSAYNGNSTQNGDAAGKTGKVEQNPLPMSCPPESNQPAPVYLYSNYNFTDVRRELEVLTLHVDPTQNGDAAVAQQRSRSASTASQESALDAQGPLLPSQATAQSSSFRPLVSIQDRSHHMGGITLPPGLRFPTGALLGPYLLISGTYLANATQSFSIWALHLPTMLWSRIESGSALSTGSWNRALLWPGKNRLVVVGHKERDLVSDYNHRQTNWDHVVVLELEAWGIYQPPFSPLSEAAVQLGLDKLAQTAPSAMASAEALARGAGSKKPSAEGDAAASATPEEETSLKEELDSFNLGGRGDFEIVCSDGLRIGCDRAILEARWPWFKAKMDEFRSKARRTLRIAYPAAEEQFSLGIIPEDIAEFIAEEDEDEEPVDPLVTPTSDSESLGAKQRFRDPRFQPRHLQISEPSPVVLALLQFIYTLRICTALQRHPAIVCALMVLARTYNMDDLALWARHAAHVALADDLNPKTSSTSTRHGDALSPSSSFTHALDSAGPDSGGLDLFRPAESLGLHPEERHRLAVCLYEAASLCGCEGLQIRALRVVMAIARWLQKHGAGPNMGGGSGAGIERQGQGRSGDGPSRDRSGSTSHYGGATNGAGGSYSSGGNHLRGGSGTNYRAAIGSVLSAAPSPALSMPSPVPSMSRAYSDTASSIGPSTPNSTYQSFIDFRGGSFSSSNDGPHNGGGLGYLNEEQGLDFGKLPLPSVPGFVSNRIDKYSMAVVSQEPPTSTGTLPPSIVTETRLLECMAGVSTETRKRMSLFGHNPTATKQDGMETSPAQMHAQEQQQHACLQDSQVSANSSQLPSPLDSPALTTFAKHRHLQVSTASSPCIEQFPVNSYGPRSEQECQSRSGSVSTPAVDASTMQQRCNTFASPSIPTPSATETVIAKDISHLSSKEIAKLEKEERKRAEKEEKERKKAEKAQYKRLAAEAVFGPKGSAGPPPALESDFAMYTAGRSATTEASSSRRSSHSGASTASPSIGSSLRSKSKASAGGQWSVTTQTNVGPWFSAPPPPLMSVPTFGKGPRKSMDNRSLSGRSGVKAKMTL